LLAAAALIDGGEIGLPTGPRFMGRGGVLRLMLGNRPENWARDWLVHVALAPAQIAR